MTWFRLHLVHSRNPPTVLDRIHPLLLSRPMVSSIMVVERGWMHRMYLGSGLMRVVAQPALSHSTREAQHGWLCHPGRVQCSGQPKRWDGCSAIQPGG